MVLNALLAVMVRVGWTRRGTCEVIWLRAASSWVIRSVRQVLNLTKTVSILASSTLDLLCETVIMESIVSVFVTIRLVHLVVCVLVFLELASCYMMVPIMLLLLSGVLGSRPSMLSSAPA